MYSVFLASTFVAAAFNYYPGLDEPNARIEAVIDKGLIAELIVRCEAGTGIVAASLIEQTYCTPRFQCYNSLERAIAETCQD